MSEIEKAPFNAEDLEIPDVWTAFQTKLGLDPVSWYVGSYQYAPDYKGDRESAPPKLDQDDDARFISAIAAIVGEELLELASIGPEKVQTSEEDSALLSGALRI